jgi:hypothetical protein
MNVKKSLENRVRGWFPQEPVLKVPLKAQMAPVNRSQSFKIKRWLHGTSAFITSLLWRQRSKRFKIGAILFGSFVLINFFLVFLVTNNSVNFFWFNFAWLTLMLSYNTLQLLISYYFKRKEPYKNHPIISPNLRLGSIIIGVIGGAILVCSYLLILFVISTPTNFSTFPFYLGIVALLMFLLGLGLDMEWRKRNKIEPFQTDTNNFH